MGKNITLDADAFSEGQVISKIWLCEQLEKISMHPSPIVWVLGGWNGILPFLLFSRGNMPIAEIRSFDIDPACAPIADAINNSWEIDKWKFKAVTMDANELSSDEGYPDIIINTSTEHFESQEWFDNISDGVLVALQGNNMNHGDHKSDVHSFGEFKTKYPLTTIMYEGEMAFIYPDWNFARYMIIGLK